MICLICISCTETSSRYPQIITPILIAQGELYGNGDEGITKQNLVIRTQEEWDNLLNAMNSVNNVSDSFAETEIDFNSYLVIAVFDEVRGNSGCSINIAHIIEYIDSIVVDVHIATTISGYDVMNQPYYIVKIPVTNKNIVFEEYNISNNTVPNDTLPDDTIIQEICNIWGIWECFPIIVETSLPIDTKITLTFDSLQSMAYASTYPQNLGYSEHYFFSDGFEYLVRNDTLYWRDHYNDTIIFDGNPSPFVIEKISCDSIKLKYLGGVLLSPLSVTIYFFNRKTD